MNKKATILRILIFFVTGIIASCTDPNSSGSASSVVQKTSQQVHLCDLNETLVGEAVRVEGRITYLDKTDPDAVYFDVQEADCQAGVWLDQDTYASLSEDLQGLIAMDESVAVNGVLEITDGENFLAFESLDRPHELSAIVLDLAEKWWLKPQTYHLGEGPDLDLIPSMNITVLHDWGALTAGFAKNPEPYWQEDSIKERWDRAHAQGMRVEAVLSILDMWFVEYRPEDAVYASSGIDLNGGPIQYQDPVGFVGCTNQHGWQEFTKEKIFKAIDWGADGIIIDDYEGSSRWTSGVPNGMGGSENGPGACFCSACETGFRNYLNSIYSNEELLDFGIADIDTFDYSEYLLEKGWTIETLGEESRKFQGWDSDAEVIVLLYEDYADFQNLEIVKFLKDLKDEALAYAKEEYGREISWSINAGELTYGAHKTYPFFDRNIGAIWQFGYPPKGSEGYHYRLGYSIFGGPRLREVFRDPIVVSVMNEYQTQNLWLIKSAEAYANLGALIEYDYITIEGASDEVAITSLTNDADAKQQYNSFVLENAEIFDFTSLESLARTAVIYSSSSIHFDMNRHITSFNGICEILADLNVQFDPIFIGDGISYPDTLSASDLDKYELIFLPNVYSLTNHQAEILLEYMQTGGMVIALGDFAIADENNQTFDNPDLLALVSKRDTPVGAGRFIQLRNEVFSADGVVEDYLKDIAAVYFDRYIENNHPGVEPFMDEWDQGRARISEETAAGIRNEILDQVENAVGKRMVNIISTENIAAQLYFSHETKQIIMHLLNYNYDLKADTVLEQDNVTLELMMPEDFEVSKVMIMSPDFEGQEELEFGSKEGLLEVKIPHINIWDVVIFE